MGLFYLKLIMHFTGSWTNSFIMWCSFDLWACTFCYIRVWVNGWRAFNEWLYCEGKWEAFCFFFLLVFFIIYFRFKNFLLVIRCPLAFFFSIGKAHFRIIIWHAVVVYFICLLNDVTFVRHIYLNFIFITLPLLP